jgi:transcriptional regulator with XRE-family HTH domain
LLRKLRAYTLFVVSNSETAKGERAATVGRRIRERRQALGWSASYLAYVLTDVSGIPTSKVDVSRRERGVREITVDQLLLYAYVLGCGIADLLLDDDGLGWITPFSERTLPIARVRPKFRAPAQAVGLPPDLLRRWLAR